MKKKILSLLIVICMVIGMLPVIALAETGLENFLFEYWDGSGWGAAEVEQGGETRYFAQADAGGGNSYLTTEGADANNYVLKIVYPADEEPTVYFNGLNMVQPFGKGLLLESASDSLDVNLVIEKDSSYTLTDSGYYGGIECYTSGTLTISSAVDPETGKLAKLTASGKDNSSENTGPATIWARGNLVIDGAVLDVEDNYDGYAIGAVGTITINDSEIVAEGVRGAFNKAPTIDAELGAVASTSDASNVVEYDAAANDTYKYVKIGADVGIGGDLEDTTDLEDFLFEYWNGSGWGSDYVAQGGKTRYYAQTEADASGYSYLVETEDADNYVLKIEYPEDELPTVYFKGLNMVQPFGWGLLFESETNNLSVNLVIEKNSYYEIASENYYGGIECYTSKTFTISSAVDPETGKLATLTMYGQDTGDGNATIWHRGDLVIDGAVLDISAEEGHAIGAAGTITVIDSEIKAWSVKELAFNKAVDIQGELGAIASITHVPNDPDLVAYDAAAADTYKFVMIGAEVALPELPADVVAAPWDIPELTLGQAKYYVIDSKGALTEEGASAESYKVAYIYEENGPTIYLNGVTMQNEAPITLPGTDMNIVVVADSLLYATGTGYAINGTAGGDVTIQSLNKAVLTLKAENPAGWAPSGSNQTGGIATFYGNVTLLNANVNVEFDACANKYSGIFVANADLIIDNSVVNIGKGHTANTMVSPIQLVSYSEVADLVIQNGSNVTVLSEANARPCRVDGTVTISDSDVEFAGEYGGTRYIWPEGKPTSVTLNYTVPYTAVASTATPAVDPEAFTVSTESIEVVPFADADVATYFYVKITVEKTAAEVVTEAWTLPELTLGQEKYYVIDSEGALTEEGATEENYKVAYIYEENGPTIYLNGVTMQNAAPITLPNADIKIVVEADSTLQAIGTGYAINGTAGGDVTITSDGDAVLTVKSEAPNEWAPAGQTNQRGAAIVVYGDLLLEGANLDVDFSDNADSSNAPSGIYVAAGDLIVDGGNLRAGLGLRSDVTEMNSPLQLVEFGGVGGSLEIKNGANVLILQDNNSRCFRYDGSLTISDSNVEIASTAKTSRPAFHSAAPVFNYTKGYTIVAAVNTVGEETKLPTIVDNVPVAPDNAAEIKIEDITNAQAYNYFKITVNEEEPEPEPEVPEYNLGVSVTFGESLDMNFYLPIAAVDANTAWTVMIDGVEVSEDKYTIEETTHAQLGKCYRVRATFNANLMYKVMSVTVRNGEGKLLAQRSMSIREYAMIVLNTAGFQEKMYALMVATLDYGALAQQNKAGNTAPLVNKDLTAEHRAHLDNFAWPTRTGDLASASQANTTTKFGVSVTFSDYLDVNFYLPVAAVDANTTWTVEIDGVEVTEEKYTIERTTHAQLGECYRVRATFYANQMYQLMSVTARNGEGELIAQRSMSIHAYAMIVLNSAGYQAKMYALMVATLDYGALAQVNKKGDTSPLVNKDVTATQRAYLTNYAWPTAG